ncbi:MULTISPECIES: Lrp/AsnC family transcriptional regulator [Pandoraea]|jgi:DNA-binding Lrp family transcriptional regulator|uniref:ArsR family transcriptional regulator n=1 Tax=Pandoraea pnomenusa TaxID=93220 RepID=A0A378YIN9_9BURK|nr:MULTISPECIES: Lrp/AsnC family transcriptional regulator [Pandoraea]AHB74520.1 ArsR family transcriptional regulator [Pandoraea pnomenusa]AHN77136.1 ArsR family transcriptional regulator [Pandoraea pnomenusa]AIU26327.1 ArsR family transcriptional regulator [Pandoraea pnomenusa]ANC43571.1 ArsR family transcriptional regulator [Pandoraea pnomenusa]MBN9091977.1 Lrp/AsnC family transcriptional regulator [Pandoraea pnomenusa]
MELDAIDLKILRELQADARLTNVELASRVNLSPSPCLARVKALEAAGYIRQRVTLLDPSKLGLHINVFIHVTLENQNRDGLDAFEAAVTALPNVMECYLMSGDADYLLRVMVSDMSAYETLITDRLSRIPGIRNIRSSFALKQVMYTTAIPVPDTTDASAKSEKSGDA